MGPRLCSSCPEALGEFPDDYLRVPTRSRGSKHRPSTLAPLFFICLLLYVPAVLQQGSPLLAKASYGTQPDGFRQRTCLACSATPSHNSPVPVRPPTAPSNLTPKNKLHSGKGASPTKLRDVAINAPRRSSTLILACVRDWPALLGPKLRAGGALSKSWQTARSPICCFETRV